MLKRCVKRIGLVGLTIGCRCGLILRRTSRPKSPAVRRFSPCCGVRSTLPAQLMAVSFRCMNSSAANSLAMKHPPASALTLEQSNTTLLYGHAGHEHSLAKLFRKLVVGPNPDLEIGNYLAKHAAISKSFNLTLSRLRRRCWPSLEFPLAGGFASLGLLTRFIPGCRVAWEVLARTVVAGRYSKHRTVSRWPGCEDCRTAPLLASDVKLVSLRNLGRPATAAPSPKRSVIMLCGNSALLKSNSLNCPLLPANWLNNCYRTPTVCSRVFDQWQSLTDVGQRTRIHGDYHLGQVLVEEHVHETLSLAPPKSNSASNGGAA